MRHPRLFIGLLLAFAFQGCDTANRPDDNFLSEIERAKEASIQTEADETAFSWEAQFAAVRAGESSQIHVPKPITTEQWRQLAEGCEGLTVLKLPEVQLEDAELELLSSLVSLRQLVLGAPVGDAGMASIGQCPSLEIVNLPKAVFTDDGLAELKQLPLLTLLRFGSPHVTNAGMEHLPEMPNLRFVHLLEVPITDAGLDPLKRLSLLESFYIDGGNCTDEGLSCLLEARPGLHLHVNQLHIPGDESDHDHGSSKPSFGHIQWEAPEP